MFDQRTTPYAALVMRLALGILFLAHFSLKFFAFTPAGTARFFVSLGLPGWLAYITMAVEFFGAIALILGIYTRIVAVVLIPILLGAIFTVPAMQPAASAHFSITSKQRSSVHISHSRPSRWKARASIAAPPGPSVSGAPADGT